jgi:acetyl-CoA carboxylase biotin carboxyl carrier protein
MSSSELSVDAELVRQLALLLNETGLTEIEYAVGERRIRVARGGPPVTNFSIAPPGPGGHHAAAPAPAAPAALADHPGAVKSPMVGTAYLAPQPGAPPFVKVGDPVTEGQVILIIEAMKVMNQIRSPRAGRVAELLVADGSPVEFGEVLMVLE